MILPDRNTAPALAPLSVPALLPHQVIFLPNGVELVLLHDPSQEVFKTDLIFEAGVCYQSQPLIASTAINMLNEGTSRHKAEEIADLFDYYGAYVDFNCGLCHSELNLISLNRYAPQTLGMLAEMVTRSIVPEQELDIFLTNRRQEYLVNTEKTSFLARKKFSALLFGEHHPYANQIDEQDYRKVSAPLVQEFYQQHIHTARCRIMACGNTDDTLIRLLTDYFSVLPPAAERQASGNIPFSPAPAGRYSVPKENAIQSSIRIGKQGVQLTHEDYAGFILLNTILGGYFGSRLMSNIREEKGYTYGIQSFNVSMPDNSYWCITTDVNREYTEATLEEIRKEIRRLQTEEVPAEELMLVKNFLHGDLLRELDGVFAQSDALKHKMNYGLDNRFYEEIIRKINACSADQLLKLANKYWNMDEMYIVTAGA